MGDTPPRAPDGRTGAGLAASLRRLFASLLEIVQTRLELVALEYEEERAWLRALLVYSMVAVFFFGIGAVLLTLFVILLFWDDHRLLAVGVVAAVYLVVASVAWALLRSKARKRPRFLSGTIGELAKDQAALRGKSS